MQLCDTKSKATMSAASTQSPPLLCTHPSAVVADGAASSQTGVEVGYAVRAADWSVLVDPAAAVHVAAARQVPVGHRQSRAAEKKRRR